MAPRIHISIYLYLYLSDSADELLVHQPTKAAVVLRGQDTSRLYNERADGKNPWRAERVVLDEQKAVVKDVIMDGVCRTLAAAKTGSAGQPPRAHRVHVSLTTYSYLQYCSTASQTCR